MGYGRVDADRLPSCQASGAQALQHPGEHRAMRFEGNQPSRARNRRVVCRRRFDPDAETIAQRQGIGRAPGMPRSE
jgi:hypothetical protein